MKRMNHWKTAFTLLEVIVVTVVIGILAAMVVPKFADARNDTSVAATSEDLHAIANALSMYMAGHGSYPVDVGRTQVVSVLIPYFKSDNPFSKTAPIGGAYDYEGPPNWNPVQISIRKNGSNAYTDEMALRLDEYMDDGNLNTGKIKLVGNRISYDIDGH